MDYESYKITIELTEHMLGTIPKNQDVFTSHILKKARELKLDDAIAEEITTTPELEAKGWTGFHSDEKGPFVYDYLVKGFLQESARRQKVWGNLKQLNDKVKAYCFVFPRRIHLAVQDPANLPYIERPLRAMTAQGPRVTVTRSDYIPAGTQLSFELRVLAPGGITANCVISLLDYGQFQGLGQWRSGSYGRFKVISMED
jgi:hypothetical protein